MRLIAGDVREGVQDPSAVKSRILDKQRALGKRTYEGFNDRWDDSTKRPTRNARTVWTITPQPFKGAHFATFPEELAARCVKAGSRVEDVVLDPFCGSGTVGQVCRSLGREFVGVDLNQAYLDMAAIRIASLTRAEREAAKKPKRLKAVVEVEPLPPFEEPLEPRPTA